MNMKKRLYYGIVTIMILSCQYCEFCFNLSDGQVRSFGESNLQKNCNQYLSRTVIKRQGLGISPGY